MYWRLDLGLHSQQLWENWYIELGFGELPLSWLPVTEENTDQ